MKNTRRKIAIILVLILFVSFMMSAELIISAAGHECSGDDCPVCTAVSLCNDVVTKLALIFSVVSAAKAMLGAALFSASCEKIYICSVSPVELRVKLSD